MGIDRLGCRRPNFGTTRLTPVGGKFHHPCLDDDAARPEPGATAITRPSSTLFRKRRCEFRTTASGIEAPTPLPRLHANPIRVSTGLAHGDLDRCDERLRVQAGISGPAPRAAWFDAETVVVVVSHSGRFDARPRPDKWLLAVIADWRKKTCNRADWRSAPRGR
jgi:hypothetical protein